MISEVERVSTLQRAGWHTSYKLTASYLDANQREHSIVEETESRSYKVGDEVDVIYKQDNPGMGTIVMSMKGRSATASKGVLALCLLGVIIGWGVMFRLFKPKEA